MKRRFAALTALLFCVMLLFCSCTEKTPDSEENVQTTAAADSTAATQNESGPVSKYSVEDKLIALTFDDGPSSKTTDRILDILEKYNSTATFFVVGYNIEKNLSAIKRANELGCEIGNHSQGHINLLECSGSELREQVDTPNTLLKNLADIDVKLFRAPGGHFQGIENDIGMPIIQWSIDTLDWKYKDASNKDRTEEQRTADLRKIADDVVNGAQKGDIVLMHDIYGFTADLCELVVPALIEKGFKLVTVSEMYLAYGTELKGGKVYYNIDAIPSTLEPIPLGNYRVKTNGGVLNVRAETDKASESLARIPNGTNVTVLNSVSGWAYVDYSGTKGWVNSAYLEKV